MKTDSVQIVFDYKGDDLSRIWIPVSEFEEFTISNIQDDVRLVGHHFKTVKSAKSVFFRFKKKGGILSRTTERILERPDIRCLVFGRTAAVMPVYVPWQDSVIGSPKYNMHQYTEYTDGMISVSIGRNIFNKSFGLGQSDTSEKKSEEPKEVNTIKEEKIEAVPEKPVIETPKDEGITVDDLIPIPENMSKTGEEKNKEILAWLGLE